MRWVLILAGALTALLGLLFWPRTAAPGESAQALPATTAAGAAPAAAASSASRLEDPLLREENAPENLAPAAPAPGSIVVLALDLATERPVPGIALLLAGAAVDAPAERTGVTDARGAARLDWPGSGTSAVLSTPGNPAYLAASLPVERNEPDVSAGAQQEVLLYLHPRQSTAFRLVERDGAPLAGVQVRSPFPDGRFRSGVHVPVLPDAPALAVSDEQGRFLIGNASGSGSLHLLFPSGSVAMASVRLGREGEQTLRFHRYREVRIRVSDDLGAPIEGARVQYGYANVNNGGAPYVRVMAKSGVTDASGEFLLDRVDEGSLGLLRLRVEREGLRPWIEDLPRSPDVVNVVLDAGFRALVRVRSETGEELRGVEVLAWTQDALKEPVPPANRDGWERAEPRGPGAFACAVNTRTRVAALRVAAEGHATRCLWPLTLAPGLAEVDVTLERERAVRVALDPAADWSSAGYVLEIRELDRLGGPSGGGAAAPDAQPVPFLTAGELRLVPQQELLLKGLRARHYRYELRDPESRALLREDSFFAGDGRLLIPGSDPPVAGASWSGIVTRAASGRPFSLVQVVCLPGKAGAPAARAVTDGEGRWRLENLPPAPLWILFQHEGFAPRGVLLEAGSGAAAAELRTELAPAWRAALRFRRAEGHFGGDYYAQVQYANGDSCPQPPLPSNAGGMPNRAWVHHDGSCLLVLPVAEAVTILFFSGSDEPLGRVSFFADGDAGSDRILDVDF